MELWELEPLSDTETVAAACRELAAFEMVAQSTFAVEAARVSVFRSRQEEADDG